MNSIRYASAQQMIAFAHLDVDGGRYSVCADVDMQMLRIRYADCSFCLRLSSL